MIPKRIGIPFTGERVGGSHMSTLLLIDGLDREIFEPVVIVHGDGEVADLLRARGIPFVIEPLDATASWQGSARRRALASVQAALPVRRLIDKHALDLVHVQDHKAFQLWVFGTRLAGRKMILHWRGPYRRTVVTRLMMRFADRILVISDYLRKKLPAEIGERAERIYNPFDVSEPAIDRQQARAALRAEIGASDDAAVLAWIGNLDRRKQPDQFVDIVMTLAEKRPAQDIRGILCGGPGEMSDDPVWRNKLDQAGSAIRHLGFRDPITPTLLASDALVVTAADEPFGRTVVEAMLAGVPVVAADDGGYVEALQHDETGFLVPPSDREAYVKAISSLLNDPEATSEMISTARRTASERFSIDRHAIAVEAVYRSVLVLPEKPSSHATQVAAE